MGNRLRIGACACLHAFSRAGSLNEGKTKQMASYDVTCSRKDGPDNDQRLEGLGGADWYHTIDEVVANIGRGDTYWVNNGKRVQVVVLKHAKSKRSYVTTAPDGLRQNNLLFLRECR
jgi:hypothetical protein